MTGVSLLLSLTLLSVSAVAKAWLPDANPIRGVSLGSLFVAEKMMMMEQWDSIGCGDTNDEWQCVEALGQSAGDAAFKRHWSTWITQADIKEIVRYGLNTIRIPLGFWMREDLVRSDEWFPRGGYPYLERVCKWARDEGLYIILDFHGAPGGQVENENFTGHAVSHPGFFTPANYERAYKFLEWLARLAHTNSNFANVGAIQILNEPGPETDAQKFSMAYEYYPTLYNRIRALEDSLNIAPKDRLHTQFMDSRWRSKIDPKQFWGHPPYYALYDIHVYLIWNFVVPVTRRDYIRHTCTHAANYLNNSGDDPLMIGEWNIGTRDGSNSEFTLNRTDAVAWYSQYFAAQLRGFEKTRGWIFWSWKVDLMPGQNDWRWSYQEAVRVGVIPDHPDKALASNPCAPYEELLKKNPVRPTKPI